MVGLWGRGRGKYAVLTTTEDLTSLHCSVDEEITGTVSLSIHIELIGLQ